jgi:hypothetical protein
MEKAHQINNVIDTSQSQAVKFAGTKATSTYTYFTAASHGK